MFGKPVYDLLNNDRLRTFVEDNEIYMRVECESLDGKTFDNSHRFMEYCLERVEGWTGRESSQ